MRSGADFASWANLAIEEQRLTHDRFHRVRLIGLQLNWKREGDSLHLDWTEIGGPAVKTPKSVGCRVEVISASIQHLRGEVAFDWRPEDMSCKLSVPLSEQSQTLAT